MKHLRLILIAALMLAFNTAKGQEVIKKQRPARTFIIGVETFAGFGIEKLAGNYKKEETFAGIKGTFRFKRRFEHFFIFGGVACNRQRGIDYTPLLGPYTWTDVRWIPEAGLGFRADIPFNYKERSGFRIEFESDLLKVLNKEYPVPTFTPSVFFNVWNFRMSFGNKFDITRDGPLQAFGALEIEF